MNDDLCPHTNTLTRAWVWWHPGILLIQCDVMISNATIIMQLGAIMIVSLLDGRQYSYFSSALSPPLQCWLSKPALSFQCFSASVGVYTIISSPDSTTYTTWALQLHHQSAQLFSSFSFLLFLCVFSCGPYRIKYNYMHLHGAHHSLSMCNAIILSVTQTVHGGAFHVTQSHVMSALLRTGFTGSVQSFLAR